MRTFYIRNLDPLTIVTLHASRLRLPGPTRSMPLPERGPSARSAGGLHPQGWARPIFSEASLLHVTHDGVAGDRRLSGGHRPPRRMASRIGRWAWPICMVTRAVDAPARPPRSGGAVRRMAW